MNDKCDQLCMAQCQDLSLVNETIEVLWTCLAFLCNVTVEGHQRTSFLSYLATNVSADTNASSYSSNCTTKETVLLKTIAGYALPVKGYLSPVIILLTIINNTMVCIVLLKPHMRSVVNVLLALIAMSDTLTWVFAFPVYIYFYATERVQEWIPYNWCYAVQVLEYYIPVIFHNASIWLTTELAIQWYICVCHPFKARTWCAKRNVIYGTGAIYLFATLIEIPKFFEYYIIEKRRRSRLNPRVVVSACVRRLHPWFSANEKLYFNFYHGFSVIFINLIPCLTLVVLNTLLIHTMRKAMRRRIQLLGQNVNGESKQLRETNSTTMMLVTVVIMFLLVEVPIGVCLTLLMVEKILDTFIFKQEIWDMLILFSNLFVLLSYPINFYIYCGMSKQFRETFKRLFTGGQMPSVTDIHNNLTSK